MCHHLSLRCMKEGWWDSIRFKPDRGNPAVRDYSGGCRKREHGLRFFGTRRRKGGKLKVLSLHLLRLCPTRQTTNITKPTGSGGRVNAVVLHGKFTFLSREIYLPCDRMVMRVSRDGANRLIGPPSGQYVGFPLTITSLTTPQF